jgi:hypothetical protein
MAVTLQGFYSFLVHFRKMAAASHIHRSPHINYAILLSNQPQQHILLSAHFRVVPHQANRADAELNSRASQSDMRPVHFWKQYLLGDHAAA